MTIKQEKFCQEYLKTGNAKQAYINAGYTSSEKSATVNASRLLTMIRCKVELLNYQNKQRPKQFYLSKICKNILLRLYAD